MHRSTTLVGCLLALSCTLLACGSRTLESSPDDASTADGASDGSSDATPESFLACTGSGGECTLVYPSCCQKCGTSVLSDFVAVNQSQSSAYHDYVCPAPIPCPGCATMIDPNLVAFCRASSCAAVDVRTDEVSRCTTDADCTLRYASCCEPCGGSDFGLIALSTSGVAEYRQQVCAPSTACPKCLTTYPSTSHAVCDTTTGHCMVQ
jgi:hypothetical protein